MANVFLAVARGPGGVSKLVVLKARQLGISWLSLAYALWLMLFRAPSTVLLFSLREAEAKELLWRLRGMYDRLPPWMQAERVMLANETRWVLSNGSRALAFSQTLSTCLPVYRARFERG